MKKALITLLTLSMLTISCSKDDKNSDGTTTRRNRDSNVATTPNDTQRRCSDARYYYGQWYDANDRRIDCGDLNPFLTQGGIYDYDNDFCRSRSNTYRVFVGAELRCASTTYINTYIGYYGPLYPNQIYYLGWAPPFGAYASYGFNCYGCGSDVSTGEAIAGTLLTVAGLGLLFGAF